MTDDPEAYVIPMKRMSWDEVRALYGPPDLHEYGIVEGFSFYSNGVSESPEAAKLRVGMHEEYDAEGRLVALVPNSGRREMSTLELIARARAACGME